MPPRRRIEPTRRPKVAPVVETSLASGRGVLRGLASALRCPNPLLGLALTCVVALATPAAGAEAGETPVTREYARAFHRGDFPGAKALAAERLRDRPDDVHARIFLGRAEAAMGRFDAAYEAFRRALRLAPDDPDALYYVGITAGLLAQQEYDRLLAQAPESARAHQLRGESYEAQGKPAEAEAEYEAAVAAGSDSVEVLVALGDLARSDFARSGEHVTEARDYYSRALERAPRSYDALYGLAVSEAFAGEHAQAIPRFRQALEEEPDSATARLGLGISLFETGQIDAAIAELVAAARLEPKMRQAYFHLARAFHALGRSEESEQAVARFRELAREEQEANAARIGEQEPAPR